MQAAKQLSGSSYFASFDFILVDSPVQSKFKRYFGFEFSLRNKSTKISEEQKEYGELWCKKLFLMDQGCCPVLELFQH